jgi:hypothetical protein
MDDRELARYYASGRVVIGVVFALFPGPVLSGLVGRELSRSPGVRLLGRMVGLRDAIIGAGGLAALDRGDGDHAAVRPWMSYGAVADAGDALAVLLAYRHLPKRKRFAVLLLALSGAASGGYLVTKFD